MLYLGVSFADATIYGTLEQTYNESTTTLGGKVISTKTGIGEYQTGGSLIGFKGSEDLGSGLKASYLYEMGVTLQTSASAPSNRQAFVGLSGGFGAVRIGKQYSASFLNAVAADPGSATGSYGVLYLAPMTGYNGTEAPLRQDQAIQYDLPSFVDGLKLTITKVWGGKNTAPTTADSLSTTETNGIKTGDGTGIAISYASGPLYVGYTTDSVTNAGINFVTNDDSIAQTLTAAAVPATSNTIIAASATSKNKLNTLTATYNLGMAKLGYNTTKMSVGAQSLSTNMMSVSVPLGAASVFLSSSSGKTTSGSTLGAANLSALQYGVNYGLSKRTVAYVHAGKVDVELATTTKKLSSYGIGVHHSF